MAEYSPGMRVIIRDEEWMVKKVEKIENGGLNHLTLHCVGVSPLVKDRQAIFLADLETITPVDPADIKLVADGSPFFRRSRLFVESQWRQKTPTDSALHVGNRAAMDLMPFQLAPAQLALSQPRQRILIADTVGLGKTLEAGILLSELIARGKGKRILVVTVKSMMLQFQKEMWNRFSIPLIRLDSNRIQRIRSQLPSNYNPFFYYDKTIVSIDTLKRDVEYRTHLENATWDIIVIDEAHNVAERGSHAAQRARLAKLLAERSDTLIMLSATPHDGKQESFASLMNMLDPTAIANPKEYGPDDIKGLFIRRFKKDVKDEVADVFPERVVSVEECPASPPEEAAYDIFSEMTLEMDKSSNHRASMLFKTSLEKALFSSPAACIKSIDERLKILEKKHGAGGIGDIAKLKELKAAVERINPASFTRYRRLVELLQSNEYGWNQNDRTDRVVIFTERIETMRFLAAQLRRDLKLKDDAVQDLYGGMSDKEQQEIVENFGRDDSPIRILVASDVASEGINLHYLSHRLIHFDIPWSLMVFQQRNGRIDRYGQRKQPDIRYFLIRSWNEKIHGDTRILQILVQKEDQANRNIGDPALLMNQFDPEKEELITAAAIEAGTSAEEFGASLVTSSEDYDPFEAMLAEAFGEADARAEIRNEETLFRDIDYLKAAMAHFAQTERQPSRDLTTVEGVEIDITPELKRRLDAVLPDEVKPEVGYMRLSPDKAFVMEEMARSMQKNMDEAAWPSTQYLWPLHPVFDWVNDKAGLLFERGEAPLIGLHGRLPANDCVFIVAGMVPNRKSTPVVDEWFGLHFSDGRYVGQLSMEEALMKTDFRRTDIPNPNAIPEERRKAAQALVKLAVAQANHFLLQRCVQYRREIDPKIYDELDKLAELATRHKQAIVQLSLFERARSEKEREVDRIFEEFTNWVKDTLEIQDRPYLRIIAAFVGV